MIVSIAGIGIFIVLLVFISGICVGTFGIKHNKHSEPIDEVDENRLKRLRYRKECKRDIEELREVIRHGK
jgi:hypothetical protein